jgi:4-oxalocrotonate tautomerase family enzyme
MANAEESNQGRQTLGDEGRWSRRTILRSAAAAAAATGVSAAPGPSPAQADAAPAVSYGAPLAEVQVPGGLLTAEQKSDMIKGVTEVIVNALKLPPAQHRALWVMILETAPGGFGVAGQPIVAASQRPPETATKP